MNTESTPSELGSTTPSPVAIQIIESVIESREERGLDWAQTTWAVDNLTRPILAENARLREALEQSERNLQAIDDLAGTVSHAEYQRIASTIVEYAIPPARSALDATKEGLADGANPYVVTNDPPPHSNRVPRAAPTDD